MTPDGRRAFHERARSIAQRGAVQMRLFSFAVVLDGVLITNPMIDPGILPDGVLGDRFQIEAGLGIPASMRRALAAQIREGPLPVALTPAG